MTDNYNIWTFTDASIARNKYYNSDIGVYGFVHMSSDVSSDNLFPWAASFQAARGFDIQIMEHAAMYLALLDIRKIPNYRSIIIVTDSDVTYNRMNDAIATYHGQPRKDWMEVCNNRNALVFNIAQLYVTLVHQGHHIDLELVKSHASNKEQRFHLLQRHGRMTDNRYIRNVNVGNNYADYYMSNIACSGNVPVLEQYGNDSIMRSLHSGYITNVIK